MASPQRVSPAVDPADGQVVIIGAGQAGFQAAASLRAEGFGGNVVLVGDEPGLPYQRPPLSKAFIKDGDAARLLLRGGDFYEKSRIDLVEGRAVRLDRAARVVALADGRHLSYDHLVLAVGARNRRPPIPGGSLPGVLDLRTLGDADRLRQALEAAHEVAVIGGGFIGLEVAATARLAGRAVTVLEATDRLMGRVVSPAMSAHFLAAHERAGVVVRLGARVEEIVAREGRAGAVRLAGGNTLGCDLVLLAIGVSPAVELAGEAGLQTADGVVVDEDLLTSDPAISAIGDCASFPHRSSGARVRLESVQNAVDQAKCVARRIVGRPTAYDAVAWFWSDQGDQKLQIAGLSGDAQRYVVRPDETGEKLTVLGFKGGRLVTVETANSPADHMAARKLLAAPEPPDLDTLERADFSLREVLRRSPR